MVSSIFGNNNLLKYYSIFIVALVFTASYFHYFNFHIENMHNYLLYGFIAASAITILLLVRKKEEQVISISDGYLLINKQEEKCKVNLKLPCTQIKYFETKFNEIVFHDTNDEIFSVKLDEVKCDKKRWEIKELLRQHVPENKNHRAYIEQESHL